MKKKYNIITQTIFVVVLSFFTVSCEKWIDPEINTDPSQPEEVPMNLLLPSVQVSLGYQMGGDVMRPACQWMQQVSGTARQSLTFDRYKLTEQDVNNVWAFGLYPNALVTNKKLMDLAKEKNAPHYAGISKILMAYTLGTMTDLWGDLPYSEAFQGDKNLTPKYDTQAEIYATINTLLDEAISDLSGGPGLYEPGADDLIYGGDRQSWKAAAYAFKARYAIHKSELSPGTAYALALDAAKMAEDTGMATVKVDFLSSETNSNPMFQFEDQRGDLAMCDFLITLLSGNSDPRLSVYAQDDGGTYHGSVSGSGDNSACRIGTYFVSQNSPVCFMTYPELKFIEAEAAIKTGDAARAATAYNAAVTESLAEYGATDAAWLTTNASETAASITIEKIMVQKYIHLFLQVEAFVDYRRVAETYITLVPASNNVNGSLIPKRYPYPTSERNTNGGNVPSITINSKVDWDRN